MPFINFTSFCAKTCARVSTLRVGIVQRKRRGLDVELVGSEDNISS